MNTYEVFYKGKRATVEAETSYKAQQKYAQENRIKKSYEITVVLVAKDGVPVVHKPDF